MATLYGLDSVNNLDDDQEDNFLGLPPMKTGQGGMGSPIVASNPKELGSIFSSNSGGNDWLSKGMDPNTGLMPDGSYPWGTTKYPWGNQMQYSEGNDGTVIQQEGRDYWKPIPDTYRLNNPDGTYKQWGYDWGGMPQWQSINPNEDAFGFLNSMIPVALGGIGFGAASGLLGGLGAGEAALGGGLEGLAGAIPEGYGYVAPTMEELGAWAGIPGAGDLGAGMSMGELFGQGNIGDLLSYIGDTAAPASNPLMDVGYDSMMWGPQNPMGGAGGIDLGPAISSGGEIGGGNIMQGLDYASAIPEGYAYQAPTMEELTSWANKGGLGDIFGKLKGRFMESPISNSLRLGSSLFNTIQGRSNSKALEALANKMQGSNEPFRSMLAQSYQDPQAWLQGPEGKAMADVVMRQLSAKGKRSSPMDFQGELFKQLGGYRQGLGSVVNGLAPNQGAMLQALQASQNNNWMGNIPFALGSIFKGL